MPVMEQIRHIGEVLGSINALMVFRDEIKINQRQCFLLVDAFNQAFEGIAEEIRQNLKFDEKLTKWKALEHPFKELLRVFREGEQYIRQCMETKDWWVKAITLSQNTDCIEFHLHNLLWCIPVVIEAIEIVGEISGCDQDEIQKKRIILSKKYEKDWIDPKLFQLKFGKQHLVSQELCNRIETVFKEDKWILMEMIAEKRSSGSMTKQENRLAELLTSSRGKLMPSSILVSSKDYQVRQRLGSGSHYKEIQWMGESFAVRHFFGNIEPLVPEISHLSSLTHSNIIHFMCSFSDEEKKECFLVMELMNKDLGNYIKETCGPRRRIPFTLPVAVDIMLQIARGMEYLHSQKIYHGNLDPSHIFVKTRNSSPDGYLHVKVSGFGLSCVKNFKTPSNQTSTTDPFIWYAPEVLWEQEQSGNSCASKFSEKADVYSFGMLCFELLTGKVPFDDGHLQGDKMSRNIRAGERPLFPFPSPKYLTSLTKRCWHTDPSQRPSFSSICRILRGIKRFLIMNPDHSNPDPPIPPVDYLDLEASLSKRLTWTITESMPILHVPFQMFAYKVIERVKTNVNFKDKSSESGSEGASVCGEENGFSAVLSEDPFSTPAVSSSSSSSQVSSESTKKMSAKKSTNGKANKQSGKQQKTRTERPPHTTLTGRSLRMNSESQLQPVVMSPGRRKTSGHASDSELA